ncbi:formylglycine-generating enzyme family protein [Runella sp. MFBS21]|uniref:formylglycine-generating enzyme family protein n=1 Tax=Runella sp. MFBS21 TaxID=3034018 RepID=UPI0023F7601C|nr:formylglycine-generating enzyme family protein [Runella sp. MFBS21]MDF7815945.1 formylglycine-generating enzyme family protein [Runella sp. MFBS21]
MKSFSEFENTPMAFTMIYVQGGIFEMGSNDKEAFDNEKPVHKVQLSSFWMGQFLVTQQLWDVVMSGPDWVNPAYFKGDNRPIETVDYATIVTRFLPRLHALTKRYYRLPTEAEWEYAAQGGVYGEKYPFIYAGSNKLEEVGWYDVNSHEETKDVGLKTPNLLGLYDMSGNLWEWCSDWYAYAAYSRTTGRAVVNPTGAATGSLRVRRGGSWNGYARLCRSSDRYGGPPEDRDSYLGFRLVLSSSVQ